MAVAAKYALWLAYHGESKSQVMQYALQAIALSEKALEAQPERVEGYYFRGIATGLFVKQNRLRAHEAMRQIRNYALRAIDLDRSFAFGGPHRLLGALYLRAPGPPAGIGSVRRAVQQLEKAYEIAPDFPENALYLAEAYIRAQRPDAARKLIEKVLTSSHPGGDLLDREEWRRQALKLQEDIVDRM